MTENDGSSSGDDRPSNVPVDTTVDPTQVEVEGARGGTGGGNQVPPGTTTPTAEGAARSMNAGLGVDTVVGADESGDTTPAPFKPEAPKFGGLTKVGTNQWAPWTGGKPKADWTELKTTDPGAVVPTQETSVRPQASA